MRRIRALAFFGHKNDHFLCLGSYRLLVNPLSAHILCVLLLFYAFSVDLFIRQNWQNTWISRVLILLNSSASNQSATHRVDVMGSLGLFVFTGTTTRNSNPSKKKKREELYIHSRLSCLTHDWIWTVSNRWNPEIVAGLISSLSKNAETFLVAVAELRGCTAGRLPRCALPSIDVTHLVLYFWLRTDR